MTLRYFHVRPLNIMAAVHWTGSNPADVEEFLIGQGRDSQWISEHMSVSNEMLTITDFGYSSPTIAQPGQWVTNTSVADNVQFTSEYQETPGTGPFAYVLDDESA